MTAFLRWLALLAASAALGLAAQPRTGATVPAAPPAAAKAGAGSECLDCHEEIKGVKARPQHDHGRCESCHAGGAGHVQAMMNDEPAPGSIALPDGPACLSCHAGNRKLMNWQFDAHAKAGSRCGDCHTIHGAPVSARTKLGANRSDPASARCAACHQDVRARFNMASHHPVQEGGMSCSSCHDPHGGRQTALRSSSEQCLTCHQALRGPMVFEHAPVTENCLNCHDPHGASSRRLLTVAQPSVCLQCHAIAQGKHGYGSGTEPTQTSGTRIISGAVLRSCTNCHSAVHGSHQDPLLRY